MGDSSTSTHQLQLQLEDEVSRLGELAKELQDSASSFISKSTSDEQSLRQRALSIDSSLHKLRTSIASSLKTGNIDRNQADKLENDLYKARCILTDGDGASFLPNKISW
ncbi:hypothetical protein ACHQM5_022357 [Ranunculus cassubicifolius]